MNNRQVNALVEAARKTFLVELKSKIEKIKELFETNKGEWSRSDVEDLLRFFHSLNGTAATIGLEHISQIGKIWEYKIRDMMDKGCILDEEILKAALEVINDIKKQVKYLDKPNDKSSCRYDEYVNMPDRGKILLIDDDITILKLLENAFTMEGYKVYICDDSASAMDTIAIVRPDVIILDIMMPQIDGYEILEKIKSKHEYCDIYVVILSAKNEVDEKIYGMRAGADDYITKPFVIGEVITRVEMIMRRSGNYKEKLLKDCLTDAYSRYYFNLRIAEELERYIRNGSIFSLAFIDIDHFKYINDKYGHQTGDYVLQKLASYILKNIRKCDTVYRYGGEEFIILLPDTTEEKAYQAIDRLRQGFSVEPIYIGGEALNFTFSAGIKQVANKNETAEDILKHADKAMYYAKKSGRNKVKIYGNEMESESFKKTILVVDDENTILKLLKDRLSNIGYNVVIAKDGAGAIKLAAEIRPDAIVLDLILPDIDGFEVCSRVKNNSLTHSSKVIILSKDKQTDSIVKGFHCGADDYVTKPFSMEELEARIIRLLI